MVAPSSPLVVITRTQPDANETAASVRALGLETVVAPLLETQPVPQMAVPAQFDGCVIFTSRTAVRMAAAALNRFRPPALCVGDGTAEAARAAGFAVELVAEGSGRALVEQIATSPSLRTKALLWLRGADIAVDLVGLGRELGLLIVEDVCYVAMAVPHLAETVRQALQVPRPKVVLLHGARAAEVLMQQCIAGLSDAEIGDLHLLCFSLRVAARAQGFPPAQLHIALAQNEIAMISTLGKVIEGMT